MKQPDTAALRERIANYTPEEELKQDMQELDGLLQEVNCQMVEIRNLLNEIHALKEELHGIHGSLKHTVQRERAAFKALEAAKESADNIVDGISNAIVKAERNTIIHAKVDGSELAKVNQCSADHIKAEKKLLEEHSKKLAKSRKTKSDGREKRKAIFEAKTKCAQKSRLLPPSGQNTSVVQTPFESCLNDAFLLNFLLKYHLKTHCQFSKKSYLYIVVMLPLCIPSRPHS